MDSNELYNTLDILLEEADNLIESYPDLTEGVSRFDVVRLITLIHILNEEQLPNNTKELNETAKKLSQSMRLLVGRL